MELRKVGDLRIGMEIRHAAFLSEDRVAVTTPVADVWEVAFGADPGRPVRLLEGRRILKPVARSLRKWKVKPAGGSYPRLAASPGGDRLIVLTHDEVLVACSLSGEAPRLIAETWGVYEPPVQFSPDGAWLRAGERPLWIFDVRSWEARVFRGLGAAGWHPSRPMLLILDDERRLRWLAMDQEDKSPSPGPPLGEVSAGVYDPVGLVLRPSGDRGIVAFENGELIGFELEPFRRLASHSVEDRVAMAWQAHGASWIALEGWSGFHLWDADENRPLTDLLPGVNELCASPSGRRFVLFEGGSMNPYPQVPGKAATVSFWALPAG